MPQSQTISHPMHCRGGLFLRVISALTEANQRRAQRQILARLDGHILRDIGLDANTVAKECAKPFWRA